MDVNVKCESLDASPVQPDILALSTAAAVPEALSPSVNVVAMPAEDNTIILPPAPATMAQIPLIKNCSSPPIIHTSPVAMTTTSCTSPSRDDKVTQLINSKVKIQPKPITAPVLPKVNLSNAGKLVVCKSTLYPMTSVKIFGERGGWGLRNFPTPSDLIPMGHGIKARIHTH